jgi:hypothetical protein
MYQQAVVGMVFRTRKMRRIEAFRKCDITSGHDIARIQISLIW